MPLALAITMLLSGCQPVDEPVLQAPYTVPETTSPSPVQPLCAVPDPISGASLCIDEVQSKNDSTLQASPGVFPDWIEVRNAGDVVLERQFIGVTFGDTKVHYLAGPDLQPGEVAVIYADALTVDPTVIPSGLSDQGELVQVFVGFQLADQLDVPPLGRDQVFGHYPSGDEVSCVASPGATNWSATPCDDVRDLVFALGQVHDFELVISEESWATLETSTTFEHPKVVAEFTFADGVFPEVEINIKGGYGSFRDDLDSQKVSFKIDLNQHADHWWRGQKKLTLNSMVQDPTFLHEYLTNHLYRSAGVAAPRVAYANLTVNGEYMGFYALVETVDEPFLDRWYGDATGHLFESAYGPDFDPGKATTFDYDNGPDYDAGLLAIEAVINTLSLPRDEATYAQLQTQVDMDQWMTNMAIEAAVWNWDGYWNQNNYRMYQDPATSRWQIIPHGTDQTWVDGWPNAYDGNSNAALYDFCLAVDSCRAMYTQKLLDVADVLDSQSYDALLDELIAITQPGFDIDPRTEERSGRDGQLDSTRSRIATAADQLRAAATP